MFFIVYVSYMSVYRSTTDIAQLLESFREKNHKNGVTGLMLYKDGNVIQVIEGSEYVVKQLYTKILADTRHTQVFKLLQGKISCRNFPDWKMGFIDFSNSMKKQNELIGFSTYLTDITDCELHTQNISALLKLFKHMNK